MKLSGKNKRFNKQKAANRILCSKLGVGQVALNAFLDAASGRNRYDEHSVTYAGKITPEHREVLKKYASTELEQIISEQAMQIISSTMTCLPNYQRAVSVKIVRMPILFIPGRYRITVSLKFC